MNSLISVVIPVYNGEKYIEQTLKMVLDSSYPNLDVVLVLDGPTDGSKEICSLIAQNDSRVRIFEKENGGIVSARNFGLNQAKGEYVCFCDQDDFVCKEMYEKLLNQIKSYHADMCFCGSGMYIRDELKKHREIKKEGVYKRKDINKAFLVPLLLWDKGQDSCFTNYTGTIWNCMFAAGFLRRNQIQFFNCTNFEDDLLFIIDCLSVAELIATVAEVLYYWRASFESETYRVKYIRNFYAKKRKVNEHIMEALGRAGIAASDLEDYRADLLWQTITETYKNECSELNQNPKKEVYKIIKECAKDSKKELWRLKKRKMIVGKRLPVFYFLIKLGLTNSSFQFYKRFLLDIL